MTDTRSAETTPIQELLALLDLEPIEVNIFRGSAPRTARSGFSAARFWARRWWRPRARSKIGSVTRLHAYFLLPGDPRVPILYEVDRSRDGKSFSSRRVVAIQHGRPIFHMSVSFQIDEPGLEHQIDAPDGAAARDACPARTRPRRAIADQVPPEHREHFLRPRPIELRPVERGDVSASRKAPAASGRLGARDRRRCPTIARCSNACWPMPPT